MLSQSSPLPGGLLQDRLSKPCKVHHRDIKGHICADGPFIVISGVAAKAESDEKKVQGCATINQWSVIRTVGEAMTLH